MERLVCLAIGYVFGIFQTAYIYGKMHGIDIRQERPIPCVCLVKRPD